MPIVISPSGQPVFALSQDTVQDFLRQGYRLPAPEPGTVPVEMPVVEDTKAEPLSLTEATLSELVALPDVGTARARKVRKLVEANNLSLDTLQAEVGEVPWVDMYNQGLVTWPGGLHVASETEDT